MSSHKFLPVIPGVAPGTLSLTISLAQRTGMKPTGKGARKMPPSRRPKPRREAIRGAVYAGPPFAYTYDGCSTLFPECYSSLSLLIKTINARRAAVKYIKQTLNPGWYEIRTVAGRSIENTARDYSDTEISSDAICTS
jgi:hypothetical protein